MSQPPHPDPKEQRILDLIPLLVELGRTADRSVIRDSRLPNAWDFGFLWQQWDRVVSGWEAGKVADLIKGLTYFEWMFDRKFGSVPPVAALFRIYASMVNKEQRDRFADWVLANTANDYTPFGTSNHGARSLDELARKTAELRASKRVSADREQARFQVAKHHSSIEATERLPNALRRKDSRAVAALLAKGADVDAVGVSGKPARLIARELGVEAWLSGDATD